MDFMNNYIDELRELAKLKDEGIITDNEFQQKKEKLLSENLETSTIKTESDVQSKKEEISPNIVDSDKKTEFSKLKKPNSKEWLKKISKVDEVDEVNEKSINKSNKSNSHIKSEWGFRFIIFSFILSGFLSLYVHISFFLILMIISPILVIMLLRKFGITGQNVKNKKIIKSGNTKYKKGQKNTRIILGGFCLIFLLWIFGLFDGNSSNGEKKTEKNTVDIDSRMAEIVQEKKMVSDCKQTVGSYSGQFKMNNELLGPANLKIWDDCTAVLSYYSFKHGQAKQNGKIIGLDYFKCLDGTCKYEIMVGKNGILFTNNANWEIIVSRD